MKEIVKPPATALPVKIGIEDLRSVRFSASIFGETQQAFISRAIQFYFKNNVEEIRERTAKFLSYGRMAVLGL